MVKENIWPLVGVKSPLLTTQPASNKYTVGKCNILYNVSSYNISETTLALHVSLLRLNTYTLITLRDNWHIN
jgi:hypothetical protein